MPPVKVISFRQNSNKYMPTNVVKIRNQAVNEIKGLCGILNALGIMKSKYNII